MPLPKKNIKILRILVYYITNVVSSNGVPSKRKPLIPLAHTKTQQNKKSFNMYILLSATSPQLAFYV